MATPRDEYLYRRNVERFRLLLGEPCEPGRRKVIETLLAEAEAAAKKQGLPRA
jgi:hypothetical protein